MITLERTGPCTTDAADMDWVNLIRAEYAEMPGLSLTRCQVERLWNLDPDAADALLGELQRMKFLRCTVKGTYVRVDLQETEHEYAIEAHLPDVRKEDVRVMLDNGVLTIDGS